MIESTTDIVMNDQDQSVAEEVDWKTDESLIGIFSLSAIYIGLGIEPQILLNDNEAISEEIQ